MFYRQFDMLCQKTGTTPTAFVRDVLELSTSKVTAWSKGSIPKYETLTKIADYFGVSIGYLFDGESTGSDNITQHERDVINAYREQPEAIQSMICKMLDVAYPVSEVQAKKIV